jgi:catechol-2,3-dioxygenase
MNITGFGRASIKVKDLDVSERFYAGALGMPILTEMRREAEVGFRVGKSNQFLLQAAVADAPQDRHLGMHHIAFVVGNNPRTLEAAAQHLTAQGIPFEQVAHEEYESLYLRDPDGHLIELYYWPEW